jgi:hypothetical protein
MTRRSKAWRTSISRPASREDARYRSSFHLLRRVVTVRFTAPVLALPVFVLTLVADVALRAAAVFALVVLDVDAVAFAFGAALIALVVLVARDDGLAFAGGRVWRSVSASAAPSAPRAASPAGAARNLRFTGCHVC